LSADELLKRKKEVRKWVVLRGLLLGLLVAAWWILFVPESVVASTMKYALGVVVGRVAMGGYLYQLRAVFQSSARD
jgi:4-amino-4-deoxy-L-arabinose transferase-like glycosyltransferase